MTDNEKRLAEALRECYPLAIGWSATYQHQHQLEELHPTHAMALQKAREALAAHDAAQQAGSVGLTESKLRDMWCWYSPYIGAPYDFARAAIAEFCRLNNYPLPKE